MTELTDTALVPLAPAGGEVALPDELIERAKDYMKEALSERTREAYGRWWRVFTDWCQRNGRQALPASPETIAGWLTCLADGADTGRPLARASINQALAAVTLAHRNAGHAFDRKHRIIAMTWSGHFARQGPGRGRTSGRAVSRRRRARPALHPQRRAEHWLQERSAPDAWVGRCVAEERARGA